VTNPNESENVDERFGIQWDPALISNGEPAADAPVDDDTPELPYEVAPEQTGDEQPAGLEAELRSHFLYPSPDNAPSTLRPALLHAYRDVSDMRHEFPVVFPDSGGVLSLSVLIDRLIERTAPNADDPERIRVHLLRIESRIRQESELEPHGRLLDLWDRTTSDTIKSSGLKDNKKATLESDLAAAREAIEGDGEVMSCSADFSERLLRTMAIEHWRDRCSAWREELPTLVAGLSDILSADFNQSREATSPEHLRSSVGTDDSVDVEAMSEILAESRLGEPLPESRRKRIEDTLQTLEKAAPLLDEDAASFENNPDPLLHVETIVSSVTAAWDLLRARMPILVGLVRALRIARLETSNRYREPMHDPFFDKFDETFLEGDESQLVPPVLLHVKTGTDVEVSQIIELLSTRLPVKILLETDSLLNANGTPSWSARIAAAGVGTGSAFVLQAPISNVAILGERLVGGLGYDGPSLFSIYVGGESISGVPRHLSAAAATEARLFPAFVFDPGKSNAWVERMDVGMNPQVETDWVAEPFAFTNTEGERNEVPVAFTVADFVLCDTRFGAHFWPVPAAHQHTAGLVPLIEYLDMDAESSSNSVPFVKAVDGEGRIHRVIVSKNIAEIVTETRHFWRHIRELGGVHNSFAARALGDEKRRIEEEKTREVEAIEQRYGEALENDLGELTKEIVQRIARQLIDGADLGAAPAVAPASAIAPAQTDAPLADTPDTSDTAEAAVQDDEDDDVVVLDDPYIDTPLCTTCNECTQLNGRMFEYNGNKQAEIKDATAGPFSDLVRAAELCPVHIIHPGKPKDPNEPDLEALVARAAKFN
jgi:ferredoxin